MKRRALLLVALAACGARQTPVIAQQTVTLPAPPKEDDFRARPPPSGPEPDFAPPEVVASTLSNGMRLLVVKTGGTLATVRLGFRGAAYFPNERFGAYTIMVRAVFGGSPSYDAHEARRVFERQAAEWKSPIDVEYSGIEATGTPTMLAPCLRVIVDLVQHANFAQNTIDYERFALVDQATAAKDSPALLGDIALHRALYGAGHPYAHTWWALDGSPKVDQAEIQRIARAALDPADATLIVAGAVDDQLLSDAKTIFSAWPASASHASPVVPSPAPARSGPKLVVVHRPASTQVHIAFGTLGPARGATDWTPLLLLHEVLGARNTSRIPATLRNREAIAWTSESHLAHGRSDTAFLWSTSVPVDHTSGVLGEIEKQLADVRDRPVPADELETAKRMFLRTIPSLFETSKSTAHAITAIPTFELRTDDFRRLPTAVKSVDASAVRQLAQRIFAPDQVRYVIVGDWSVLEKPLTALGWTLEVRDTSGAPFKK